MVSKWNNHSTSEDCSQAQTWENLRTDESEGSQERTPRYLFRRLLNAEMNSRQLRKLLTEQYSKLTKEEKKKYYDLAHEDAKRYERELEENGIKKSGSG